MCVCLVEIKERVEYEFVLECVDGGEKGGLFFCVIFFISRILKLFYMGMKNV